MIASAGSAIWQHVATSTHLAGACASATVAAMLWRRRDRFGTAGPAIIASLMLTAGWCLAVAVAGGFSLPSQCASALRNLAYLVAIYRLFASDGRHTSVTPVRPVVLVLALVNLLQPGAVFLESRITASAPTTMLFFHFNIMLAMLGVVGSLMLVHNLYIGADGAARRMLRWPSLALALVWVFDLNLYTVAYLGNRWPEPLAAIHGVVDVGFAISIAFGALRGGEQLRLRPSRAAAFRSVSLLVIGAYFFAMVAVAQWLADTGGDFARWLQFGFLLAATVAAVLVLPSRRMRGWLRVMLAKHLFQHRYDYRGEWLRFTHTIGCKAENAAPLHARVIQALADITESPAGLLLVPDDAGDLVLAERWQWPTADVPPCALPLGAIGFLERHEFILDLDEHRSGAPTSLRPGVAEEAADFAVPEWLAEDPRAWALVPLLHYERLVGAVVLARPPQARRLDWEDFDLLRVVGQQLASFLAEHNGQQALAEAARFDDFNRRIAFVMHDIKNLASQLSLLAGNAERHAENPAFRADMLVTLRSSADRLGGLLARLSRYGGGTEARTEAVDLGALSREVAASYGEGRRVTVIEREPCLVTGSRHAIEQVLRHLVQNGIDASSGEMPVFISLSADDPYGRIEIVDSGHGMSPEFLRTRLFRPFESSKPGGFGIGAYEARELVRGMHGRLEVESREGMGTRFVIRLLLDRAAAAATTDITQPRVA